MLKLCQRLRWFWHRNQLHRLEQEVRQALARGDLKAVMAGLEQQQQLFAWPFQTEALLFKRNVRPGDPLLALDLLEAIQASAWMRAHQRFYAGIAAAYSTLALDQVNRFERLVDWLHQQVHLDGCASGLLSDRSRNRENTYKQLISARVCLLQYALAERDQSLAQAIAEANLRLLHSLDPKKLPADVLYRSVTNLLRGLLPLSTSLQGCARLVDPLAGLLREIQTLRYRHSRLRTQENHLAMLQLVFQSLHGAFEGESSEQRQERLELMINSSSERVKKGLNEALLEPVADC